MDNLRNNFQLDDFDIKVIFQKITKNIWPIFCISGAAAMLVLISILYIYHPKYQQTVNFYVEYETEDTTKFLTYLEDTNTIASSVKNIIDSQLTRQKLKNQFEDNSEISIGISTNIIGSTNLFSVTFFSESAETTYQLSKAIVEIIPQIVTELYGDAPVVVRDIHQAGTPKLTHSFSKIVKVSLAVGLLVACFLMLIIIIREFYRDTVKTPEQCSRKLGEPALVKIPHEKKSKKDLKMPSSLYKKSFYDLANQLISKREDETCSTIIFTSANSYEGTSTVLAHTAISLAENGYRVVMVDLNFRYPKLCKLFGVESEVLYKLISGTSKDSTLVCPIKDLDNLTLLANSTPSDYPISNSNLESLKTYFEQLSKNVDFILFNSPSVYSWVNIRNIQKYANEFVLIVKRNTSKVNSILEAQELLIKAGIKPLGFIFNDAYKKQILKEDVVTKMFIGRSTYGTKRA